MKKLSLYVFLILFLANVGTPSFAERTIGKGEVKLSLEMLGLFIDYIRGGHTKSPESFVITNDGYTYVMWGWCQAGTSNCRGGSRKRDVELCEQKSGKDCSVFAKRKYFPSKESICHFYLPKKGFNYFVGFGRDPKKQCVLPR